MGSLGSWFLFWLHCLLSPMCCLCCLSLLFLSWSPPCLWSDSFCWPSSAWILPDDSGCFLLHIYNKTTLTINLHQTWPPVHCEAQANLRLLILWNNSFHTWLLARPYFVCLSDCFIYAPDWTLGPFTHAKQVVYHWATCTAISLTFWTSKNHSRDEVVNSTNSSEKMFSVHNSCVEGVCVSVHHKLGTALLWWHLEPRQK